MFSRESIRRAVRWLLVAAAGLATLTPLIPDERARGVCLQAAGLLLLLDAALLVYYGLRFGRAFLGFLIRRLALMVVTLVGITLVTFLVVRFAPGDPVSALAGFDGIGQNAIGLASQLDIRRTRSELLGTQAVHTFRASATDPDGDRVRLEFDWGDEWPLEKSREVASGTEVGQTHAWWQAGNYEIRVRAIDEHDARSGWSPPFPVKARQGKSLPPTPPRPWGRAEVDAGTPYTYTVDLVDPGDDVTVVIDWGDDTRRPARRMNDKGAPIRRQTWRGAGIFKVRARAVGPGGAVSDWSEPLEVVAFDARSLLAGPVLSAARDHASSGESLSFTARAVSRSASDLTYTLRVREDGAPPDPAPPAPGVTKTARNGAAVELSHIFGRPGRYLVEVSVVEAAGGRAPRQSLPLPVTIHDTNRPPLTPARPEGPAETRVETTIIEQYLRWLTNVARLDFGRSHTHKRQVWPLIRERLPRTLILSALSLFLAYLIAIPVGVYSSTHRHSVVDRCLGVTLFTLYSLPSFWVATMLIVLAADYPRIPIRGLSCVDPLVHPAGADVHVPLLGLCLAGVAAALAMRLARRARLAAGLTKLLGVLVGVSLAVVSFRYLPVVDLTSGILLAAILTCVVLFVLARRGRGPSTKRAVVAALITLLALVFVGRLLTFDLFWHAFLPVACLTYGGLAALSRYTRSGLLDVVQQDYVRTARATGLPERTVIFKHALRNGLIPVLTLFATILPQLISGSVIIESIFSIEGMGLLLIESVRTRDYNVTMAVTTLTAIMTMLGLLLSDVLYVVVDPRISFDKRTTS